MTEKASFYVKETQKNFSRKFTGDKSVDKARQSGEKKEKYYLKLEKKLA